MGAGENGAADGDFAVTHDGVDVAKTQVRAEDLNRELERGTGGESLVSMLSPC